jgi:hypothetical protein
VREHKVILSFIMLAFLVIGCAGQQKELLARDYMHMSNNELLRYYYQLSDEIETCVRESTPSVGIGTGFGITNWLGLGLGVSKGISTCNPDKLRQRRIDVRVELQHRGINP